MLVSLSGVVRLVLLFFVLGIVVGVYFGVGGAPDAAPPPPIDNVLPVNQTAP
jgi:hypothetical protein